MPLFKRSFYDFYTHPSESITEFAYVAKKYGYSGIAVFNSTTDEKLENRLVNFTIYEGVELSGTYIKSEIKKHRSSILLVRGGNEKLNRAVVETDIDILLQPIEFNHIIARMAGENSVAIGFDLGSIIRQKGDARIKALKIMRTNLKYARKYKLPMILTSNARSCYDLRSPREMVALAGLFGMTKEEAVDAMSTFPLQIVRRKNPNYIRQGVEIL